MVWDERVSQNPLKSGKGGKAMSSGTASIEVGHFAELTSAVIQQLPRDIDSTTAQGWIENRAALQRALRAALLPATQSVHPTYPVSINYGLSLEEMIAAGRYDWKNDDITAKHFPERGEGVSDIEIQLVHFNRVMGSSDEVIREFDKMGLRPASIEELLAFGAKYPDVQRQFPIVALKSLWRRLRGHRYVPYLDRNVHERCLYLYVFEGGWYENYRFAAVRK